MHRQQPHLAGRDHASGVQEELCKLGFVINRPNKLDIDSEICCEALEPVFIGAGANHHKSGRFAHPCQSFDRLIEPHFGDEPGNDEKIWRLARVRDEGRADIPLPKHSLAGFALCIVVKGIVNHVDSFARIPFHCSELARPFAVNQQAGGEPEEG
ncbi:hypothetical protein IMCC12053_16 [Celeribacter marinus]|uniref:Uncharacterized protein n=1 Tax=Celeribacter marinus TaxID=1397108 RepID=A0A0P0A1A4_9RHOB|nr:hypothetical protein IMCC12053_16 [Celeribacter marinus]